MRGRRKNVEKKSVKSKATQQEHYFTSCFFVNDNDPVPVNFLENVGEIYFIMKIIGFACKLECNVLSCWGYTC